MKHTREEIIAKLKTIIVEQLACYPEHVTGPTTLEALGADSLDRVEIIMAVEVEFGIEINEDEAKKIKTVEQMAELIERLELA